MKGEWFFGEPTGSPADHTISRRQLFTLAGGILAYGALAAMPGIAAWAQMPAGSAASPNLIQGRPIATKEQAHRWLSANGAREMTHRWVDLAWMWGGAVGVRPDLMLAQEMFETGWGHFGGIVTPKHRNVAGIKVGDPSGADLPRDYERFGSWSEGIRAHANHLAAYSGAAPVLGPNGEPVHARYHVVEGLPWAGTVKTIGGLSRTWSTRNDYAQALRKNYLNPLRNA